MLFFIFQKKWQYFLKDFCKVISSNINLFFFWRVYMYFSADLEILLTILVYFYYLIGTWYFGSFFDFQKLLRGRTAFLVVVILVMDTRTRNPKTWRENPTYLLPEPNPSPNNNYPNPTKAQRYKPEPKIQYPNPTFAAWTHH